MGWMVILDKPYFQTIHVKFFDIANIENKPCFISGY